MADALGARNLSDELPPPHSLERSSTGLLIGKGSQMILGYAFWLVAARLAPPSDVGLASGALSGVMIVTQLALLGIGSAVILRLPKMARHAALALTDSALTVVSLSALVAGAVYVALLRATSVHLQSLLSQPAVILLLLGACAAGTVGVCLDQISTALGRGGLAAPRGVAAGVVGVVGLLVLAGVLGATPESMLLGWTLGLAASMGLGLLQLHRLLGYRPRPRVGRGPSPGLLRDGIPNQLLTLTERVPALVLPLLISGYVSPTRGAYWYPVWMMAWAVFLAPVMVGQAQFAADVRADRSLAADVRASLRWSLAMGSAAALVLALGADVLLGMLGADYAAEGATALRVLLLALPGVAVIQAYSAACRARRRIGEAIALGVLVGIAACGGALAAAATRDLVTMSLVWVVAQSLGGLAAGARLRWIIRTSGGGDGHGDFSTG